LERFEPSASDQGRQIGRLAQAGAALNPEGIIRQPVILAAGEEPDLEQGELAQRGQGREIVIIEQLGVDLDPGRASLPVVLEELPIAHLKPASGGALPLPLAIGRLEG